MVQVHERLRAAVAQHGKPGAEAWLAQALDTIATESLDRVRVAIARCARKVGDAPLGDDEFRDWTARDAARALLVLRAFEVSADEAPGHYGAWLRRGEHGEQISLLRVLPWLPEPASVLVHAIEACRTNAEPVFRAIACGNPYPAAHFPTLNFNQLVLKAVFLGVPLAEMDGLGPRVDADLLRMADDYAAERQAAGRSVPTDIAWLHQLSESA